MTVSVQSTGWLRLDEEELLGRIVESLNAPTIVEESTELDGTLADGLDSGDDFRGRVWT